MSFSSWSQNRQRQDRCPGVAVRADGGAQADLEVHTLLALQDTNELTGNNATLVDELVERVLPVSAGLAKVHLAGLERQAAAIDGHSLAVALHGYLAIANLAQVCMYVSQTGAMI